MTRVQIHLKIKNIARGGGIHPIKSSIYSSSINDQVHTKSMLTNNFLQRSPRRFNFECVSKATCFLQLQNLNVVVLVVWRPHIKCMFLQNNYLRHKCLIRIGLYKLIIEIILLHMNGLKQIISCYAECIINRTFNAALFIQKLKMNACAQNVLRRFVFRAGVIILGSVLNDAELFPPVNCHRLHRNSFPSIAGPLVGSGRRSIISPIYSLGNLLQETYQASKNSVQIKP